MGAHTSLIITREDAIEALTDKLRQASESELERLMDDAFYDDLFNFKIVYSYEGRSRYQKSWPNRYTEEGE